MSLQEKLAEHMHKLGSGLAKPKPYLVQAGALFSASFTNRPGSTSPSLGSFHL